MNANQPKQSEIVVRKTVKLPKISDLLDIMNSSSCHQDQSHSQKALANDWTSKFAYSQSTKESLPTIKKDGAHGLSNQEIKLRKKFIKEVNQAYKIAPFLPAMKAKSKKIVKSSNEMKLLNLRKANTENHSSSSKKCMVSIKFSQSQNDYLSVHENSFNYNKTTVNDSN